MSYCIVCDSERILEVYAKCNDMCVLKYKDAERADYVPRDIGIGGGDSVSMTICLECGMVQDAFPKPEPAFYNNYIRKSKDNKGE